MRKPKYRGWPYRSISLYDLDGARYHKINNVLKEIADKTRKSKLDVLNDVVTPYLIKLYQLDEAGIDARVKIQIEP